MRANTARSFPRRHARRLLVHDGRRTVVVPVDELEVLSSAQNYVELSLRGKCHLLRSPLGALERQLDPTRFMRVHRRAIVNVAAVLEIDRAGAGWELVLRSGKRQAVARERRAELLRWLADDERGELRRWP